MNFVSTRGAAPPASLSDALAAGLAPDGGLYVPASWPTLDEATLDAADTLAAIAVRTIAPFAIGDRLAPRLVSIADAALDFPTPLRALASAGAYALELFHGPTAAFKDVGARFLAACLTALRDPSQPPLTILVATSGDTGAAVGAAFHRRPGFRVVILYPDGRVSPRQAHQLGCFGDNVVALRVVGAFDDCQRLVKQALADDALKARVPLSSANSISVGRLLPQMSYYAQAGLAHRRAHGRPLGFVVPTGNLGNALAALLARRIGVPIGPIALATNANRTLADVFAGGPYAPRASVATLANAMDVGAPSNFERLRWLFADDEANLRASIRASAVDDDAIRRAIADAPRRHGFVPCPHTATALVALDRLRAEGDEGDYAVVATAHPAKFDTVIAPILGRAPDPPPALAALLARPSRSEPLAADYAALRDRLLAAT